MRLVILFAALFIGIHPAAAQIEQQLIVNGDMMEKEGTKQVPAGWKAWLWSGQGEIDRFAPTDQKPATVIVNSEPAKQAIFQTLNLTKCTYRLTAEVAAYDLVPVEYDRASTIHIAFENGGDSITEDLLRKGSTGWQRLELTFSVSDQTPAIIYFFNYGIGRFFVRDVGLAATEDCAPEKQTTVLRPLNNAPLGYSPPWKDVDFTLSGYCDDQSFASSHELCSATNQANSKAGGNKEANILADFEGWTSILRGQQSVSGKAALSGTGSARLLQGQYVESIAAMGLPKDWSGYDWLRIDTANDSPQPVSVYLEINDAKTTGYWSRVNWTTAVPPGSSTIDVPLSIFVGEKVVTKERRRLDLTTISRLVLTATDGSVTIDNVRLEQEPPFHHDFNQLIRLDFGNWSSPVMHSFTAVLADAFHDSRRGFGFAAGTRIGRSEDRRHPDNLFRDWVSILGGGFNVDLPNGRYRVWMMLEDPGYWEYYPSAVQRRVVVEGNVVESGIKPYAEFASRFWRHADDEDLPGDDIWKRYIPARYRPIETVTDVKDGQLNIDFNGFDDPHAVTLSALIIYPERRKADGDAFILELWQRLKFHFDRENRQVEPARPDYPQPEPNALGGDLSIYSRGAGRDISANDWPEANELGTAFNVDLPFGTTVPLVIGLLAKSDLEIVSAQLKLPGINPTLLSVRNKVTRRTADGTVYANVPRVLDPVKLSPDEPLVLKANKARALWIDLAASDGAIPELHPGHLVLTFRDGRSVEIAINVAVKPWKLPPADVPFGYLGLATRYPMASYPEIARRRENEFEAALSMLPAFGMTAVSGGLGGPRLVGYDNGGPQVDVKQLRASLDAIGRAGFDKVLSYDGLGIEGLSTSRIEDTEAEFGKPYASVLRDVLNVVDGELARTNVREIVHVIADEPTEDDVETVIAVANAFKQTQPATRTAAFTSITEYENDRRSKLAGVVGQLLLNNHSEEAIRRIVDAGSQCSLYNQSGRYRRGIYHFKLRDLNCAGHMQFAFHSAHVDHWYDLDSRESDFVAVFTHPDGKLRVALEMMRYRQSINDYRHLLLLDNMTTAGSNSEKRKQARQWLASLKRKMVVGQDSPWRDNELDAIRRQAVRYIDELFRESRPSPK